MIDNMKILNDAIAMAVGENHVNCIGNDSFPKCPHYDECWKDVPLVDNCNVRLHSSAGVSEDILSRLEIEGFAELDDRLIMSVTLYGIIMNLFYYSMANKIIVPDVPEVKLLLTVVNTVGFDSVLNGVTDEIKIIDMPLEHRYIQAVTAGVLAAGPLMFSSFADEATRAVINVNRTPTQILYRCALASNNLSRIMMSYFRAPNGEIYRKAHH